MTNQLIHEFWFCLKLWEEQWGCAFGWGTRCDECGTLYLLHKLLTGEVLHGDMKRLTLAEWQEKAQHLKNLHFPQDSVGCTKRNS